MPSSDNMNLLEPGGIPSIWRIPVPRVDLRRAAASSSGGNNFRSVKPVALNLLELIIIATGICEESTFSVGSHSSKCETRRILIHTVQPPLDLKSTLAIVKARTLVFASAYFLFLFSWVLNILQSLHCMGGEHPVNHKKKNVQN